MFHSAPPESAAPIDVSVLFAPRADEVRRLGPADAPAFEAHLLRLDETARRLRFGAAVGERFVRDYAGRQAAGDATRIGLFREGVLQGAAELHVDAREPALAEGAFSLEAGFRRQGLGTRLFAALLAEARSRGVERLTLQCLRENLAMQRIARRFRGELVFEGSEITATLAVPAPPVPLPLPPAPCLSSGWPRLPPAALSFPVPA